MNPEQPEPSLYQASALQALSLSDIEEGLGHNVKRTQELQLELAQRRASLESAKAQALQGKEALLADIIKRGDGSLDPGIGLITVTVTPGRGD